MSYVLLVEDDPDDALLARIMLESAGLAADVVLAPTAAAARERLCGSQLGPPQMVVLDLHLPDGDGLDLLGEIRANAAHRSLTVVVLTGTSDAKDFDRARERGCSAVMKKPRNAGEYHAVGQMITALYAAI